MKLRTSFFNGTVLRKDITRFAPVWGLYSIFTLMAFFLIWESENTAARFANNASYVMQAMGIVNFAYATICALVLFGDLFNTKLCNALHAFPLRREGWFLTHCAAGFLFCLVPNTAAALLAAALLQEYCYLAFLWLAIMLLQFLFFFGAAVFSVMCAGNRLGALAVCGIFNLLAVLVAWLFMTFYDPFLYGIELDVEPYLNFSPVVGFHHFQYVETVYDKMANTTVFKGFLAEQWQYLFIAAGVGAVLLVLALLIYRGRHLENAGNLISLKPVGPVFLIIYTLCAGAVMYYVSEIFSGNGRYVFIFLGFAIGFFTGKMLLEKKVNVFRWKTFLGFGILLTVFGITVGLTKLDPAGVTRYVPEVQEVKQVQISPNASRYYYEHSKCILTEQADIEAITKIHQELVDNRKASKDSALRITYTLQSGRTVERQYYVDMQSDAAEVLRGYYSSPQYILGTEDIAALLENAFMLEFRSNDEEIPYICIGGSNMDQQIYVDKYEENAIIYSVEDLAEAGTSPTGLNVELARGLMDAILADCKAGKMAPPWEYHEGEDTFGWLTIQSFMPQSETLNLNSNSISASISTYEVIDYTPVSYLEVKIFENCTNTIEYLKSIAEQ